MNATATAAIAIPATGIAGNATPVLGELSFLAVVLAAAVVGVAAFLVAAAVVVAGVAVVLRTSFAEAPAPMETSPS